MSRAASPLVKRCEYCSVDFRRPTGTSRISDDKWAARRFCSNACGSITSPKSAVDADPNGVPTHDRLMRNAEKGSATLLDKQMAFYHRTARERGLNGVWEAAVALGMAA